MRYDFQILNFSKNKKSFVCENFKFLHTQKRKWFKEINFDPTAVFHVMTTSQARERVTIGFLGSSPKFYF